MRIRAVWLLLFLNSALAQGPLSSPLAPHPPLQGKARHVHRPNSDLQTLRAELAAQAAFGMGHSTVIPPSLALRELRCPSNGPRWRPPLPIVFSPYTLDSQGRLLLDGGWTAAEYFQLNGFLCRALPFVSSIYGPAWNPTGARAIWLQKDLKYARTNIFITRTDSIHAARPETQLLIHEIFHAMGGPVNLTASPGTYSNYSPKLSGFEEGFAQYYSYKVMNLYRQKYPNDPFVKIQALWVPDFEWNYDFKNDQSMITESFFSESGGTWKYWERYEHAAAAIGKLDVVIPNFYARFNQIYFKRIRNVSGPSRDLIFRIIETLSPTIAGVAAKDWLEAQNIFRCQNLSGKKIFTVSYSNGQARFDRAIHFVESFPNGSEWAIFIRNVGKYLYHRLNTSPAGRLDIKQAWDGLSVVANIPLKMQRPSYWPRNYQACGINCSAGFRYEGLSVHYGKPNLLWLKNPVLIPVSSQSNLGLYELGMGFVNPHYSANPMYGFSYDRAQRFHWTIHHALMGGSKTHFDQNDLFGGTIGLSAGTVEVRHSGSSVVPPVIKIQRGAFSASVPAQWKQTLVLTGGKYPATVPGVLTFKFTRARDQKVFWRRRIILQGLQAKHRFLFLFFENK